MVLGTRCKVGPDEVAEIAAIDDDGYRNRWIVYGYHDISTRLRPLLGDNASFATFATWSSRVIGEHIRTDVRPGRVLQKFDQLPNPWWSLCRPLLLVQRTWRERNASSVSQVMGTGNRLIFLEIARELARFVDHYGYGGPQTGWGDYRTGIAELDESPLFPAADLELFREGMHAYYLAAHEEDPQKKAELVFRGTLLISSYEQGRVDFVLKAALSLFPRRFLQVRPRHPLSFAGHPDTNAIVLRRREKPWRLRHRSPWRRAMARGYARLLTREVMTVEVPRTLDPEPEPFRICPDLSPRRRHLASLEDRKEQFEELRLGRQLNQVDGEPSLYLAPLAELHDPSTKALFESFDRSRGTAKSCYARDWGAFEDRMSYIANYFRARQGDGNMFARLPYEYRIVSELDVSDTNLDRMRDLADPEADQLATAVALATLKEGRDLLPELVRIGLGPSELVTSGEPTTQMAALGRTWYADPSIPVPQPVEPRSLPLWACAGTLTDGQIFFQRYKMEIGSALFNAGLPSTYTSAKGARVLTETADRLSASARAGDVDPGVVDLIAHAERRIGETGQMLLDVMGAEDHGAEPFGPTTRAYQAARGVRFFHAAVRHQLSVGWDEAQFGKPINQEDMLGTLAVFTVVVIDALHKMGAKVSQNDRDAYVHTWLVVGHFMGIDYQKLFAQPPLRADLPPLSYEELRLIVTRYHQRHARDSDDGCRLQESLLDVQQRQFPWVVRRALKGLPASSVRYFLDNKPADDLRVPSANWTRHLLKVMKPYTTARTLLYCVDPVSRLVRRRSYRLFGGYIKKATRGTRPQWRLNALLPRRSRTRSDQPPG